MAVRVAIVLFVKYEGVCNKKNARLCTANMRHGFVVLSGTLKCCPRLEGAMGHPRWPEVKVRDAVCRSGRAKLVESFPQLIPKKLN